MLELSDRQQNILSIIVQEYINTNKPVGSIVVSKYIKNLSPSTIRSEMNYLEKQGFIRTESSLGRIPHKQIVLDALSDKIVSYENLTLEQVTKYCNQNNLSFFKKNILETDKISTVFLHPINENKVLLTIILESENIYNKIIQLEESISPLELLKINESLKKILQNNLVEQLKKKDCLNKYKSKKEFVLLDKIIDKSIYADIENKLLFVYGFETEKVNLYHLTTAFETRIEDNQLLFLYKDKSCIYGFKTNLKIEEYL